MPVDHSGFWIPPATVHPTELHGPLPSGYICRSPVPTFPTQTPCELLAKLYIKKRNEPDWTDPNGVLSKQMEVFNKYPENAAAPIGSSGLIGKWRRPGGLPAVPVPVYGAGSTLDGPQVIVQFINRDRGCPSTGIPLSGIYGGNSDALVYAEDIVLYGFGGKDLKFVIAWPGYEPEWSTIRTVADDGGRLTRFDLGQQITTAYALFFRKVEIARLLPSEVGFYNIALHQGRNSRPDSLGVQLMQIHLVRFRNTIGGVWVADVEIV